MRSSSMADSSIRVDVNLLDKLMTLVTVFLTGIARISHIDRTLAGEPALARSLGLDRFPSSDTLYNLLGEVTAWHRDSAGGYAATAFRSMRFASLFSG